MVKVKNVQPGIVIIADAGLKLGPGETAEVARLTPQAEKAIEDGLLARVDAEPEPKKTKKTDEQPKQPEAAKSEPEAKNGAG